MIEAAILLPLIFLAIFMILALGVVLNARGALATGMTEALRLAHTRGNALVVGRELLPMISAIQHGTVNDTARELLTSLPESERSAGVDLLDACFAAVYDRHLHQLPPQHLYTLVYLNQALAQSIGPSFRFPCLPPGATPPAGCAPTAQVQAGCGACYLFDPENPESSSTNAPLLANRIGIRCEYAPAGIFIEPIVRLLGLFGLSSSAGGMFTLRRERLFDASELGL